MPTEHRFRAMGSDAHVVVVGGPRRLIEAARSRIELLERRWSRFIDNSEISQLNRSDGTPVIVSGDTRMLVARAIEAWRISGGAYDPTVLGAVIRAGYDRPFEGIGAHPSGGTSVLGMGADGITIDGESVKLLPGTGFDPGGIGKGLAADIVADEVIGGGADGVCVNLGGDVRARGTSPTDDGSWTVGLVVPWATEPIALLGLKEGAVATSATLRRSWHTNGELRHHLIDPLTGRPSDTDIALATVIDGRAWVAEVLAKAVLLAGSRDPFDIIGGTGAHAIAIGLDGTVAFTEGVPDFLGGAVLPSQIPPP